MEEIIKKLDKKLKVLSYEYIDDILSIYVERTNKSAVCPYGIERDIEAVKSRCSFDLLKQKVLLQY